MAIFGESLARGFCETGGRGGNDMRLNLLITMLALTLAAVAGQTVWF